MSSHFSAGQLDQDFTSWSSTNVCTSQTISSAITLTKEEGSIHHKVTFQLPVQPQRVYPSRHRTHIYRKSPLKLCDNAGDDAKDQIHSIPKDHRHTLNTLFQKHSQITSSLRSIDLVGFRYLRQPLQVEYSPYLQRWMFAAEIEKRTRISNLCKIPQCCHNKDGYCMKTPDIKQFTRLDDGYSWLLTGDLGKDGIVKQRKGVVRDMCPLYALAGPRMMRKQTEKESNVQKGRLECCEGRFLRWKDEPIEYTNILKYIHARPSSSIISRRLPIRWN